MPKNHDSPAARAARGSVGVARPPRSSRQCSAASLSSTDPVRARTVGMPQSPSTLAASVARRCDGTRIPMSEGRTRRDLLPRADDRRVEQRPHARRDIGEHDAGRRPGLQPVAGVGDRRVVGHHAEVHGRLAHGVVRRRRARIDADELDVGVTELGRVEQHGRGRRAAGGRSGGWSAASCARRCARRRGRRARRRRGIGRSPAWDRRR